MPDQYWEIEQLPDGDSMFYRVPVGWLGKKKKLIPGVFKKNGDSMSTDWEKYSTANATRCRTSFPERFAVVRLPIGCVRRIQGLTVRHDPIYETEKLPPNINRAHCAIAGVDPSGHDNEIGYFERVRLALLECVGDEWEIQPGAPLEACEDLT